jgi:hypothetical protein
MNQKGLRICYGKAKKRIEVLERGLQRARDCSLSSKGYPTPVSQRIDAILTELGVDLEPYQDILAAPSPRDTDD